VDTYSERGSTHPNALADPSPRGREVLRVGIGLYLLLVGGLMGSLVERVRFDQRREAVLARYDALLEERNARVMEIERAIARRFAPTGDDMAAVAFGMPASAAGN
jgi:hypothetical protein